MKMTPNLALTVFCALLGFSMGCGQAQFHLGGGYTMGDVGAALLLSIATFIWIREDAWRHSYARSPAFNVSFVGLTRVPLGLGCLMLAGAPIAVTADASLPWAFKGKAAEGYSIDLVGIDPLPGTKLVQGSSVPFKLDVSYLLSIASHGKIILVFQTESNVSVNPGDKQVSADASGPSGTVTLDQTVVIPAHAKELRLFVPIVPDGVQNTSGELTFRYPIIKAAK